MNNDRLDPRIVDLMHQASVLGIAHITETFADVIRTGQIPEPMASAYCGPSFCVGEDKQPVQGCHSLCLLLEVLQAGHVHLTAVNVAEAKAWADAHPALAKAIEELE